MTKKQFDARIKEMRFLTWFGDKKNRKIILAAIGAGVPVRDIYEDQVRSGKWKHGVYP